MGKSKKVKKLESFNIFDQNWSFSNLIFAQKYSSWSGRKCTLDGQIL